MINSVKHLPDESRLEKLKLWSLEDRHICADLIEVFKIVHGISSVSFQACFEYSSCDCARGDSLKLNKRRIRPDLQQHFII